MFEDYTALLTMLVTIGSLIKWVIGLRQTVRPPAPTVKPPPKPPPKPPLKDPITYTLLGINLLMTGLLPLQLYGEFPAITTGSLGYAPYSFYFRHYPHLTIYPILFFGLAVLLIFRALYIWREHAPGKLLAVILFAAALALGFTYWEVSGRQMMLLEFNKEAQSATELFSPEKISEKAKAVGLSNAFNPPLAQQVIAGVNNGLKPPEAAVKRMDELLNHYEAWEGLGVPWKSKSRTFYMIAFFYITFVLFIGMALVIFLPRTKEPKSVQEARDANISWNLLGAFFVFLSWMPFRMVSNINTKIPLFGPDNIWDNFFGKIPFVATLGFTAADILPLFVTLGFPIILVVRIRRISRKYTIVLFALGGVLVVSAATVLARVDREGFLQVTGANQEPKYIAFRILFALVVTLFLYHFVESMPKNGENGAGKAG